MKETPEQRSRTMRAVHSRDTAPEMAVRRFLHASGLRYRLHDRRLPGVPDLVFPSRKTVVFVHGCFWHQHPNCPAAARPQSRTDYWTRKLEGNIARDARHRTELESAGWRVLVIWECETRNREALETLAARIRQSVESRGGR
ncbi:very short patch repair endonuclease [Pelomicrobium methylotrophicum]|uniref:Very short patch repair endonuclease n=1 Tax=Pelomicrobium methylotrophicum TaxID=2602750 RepID=A0A5C7EVS2_9PROT|nr:very short patch repair endonuclease [Pelomicrobium methylotrophicum]TXF11165.1 DNA mismatch endonuclease Vsr [Pelomicrobium methylotrophicum]